MTDNQYTSTQERLNNATPYILSDRKIWKRLRYNYALRKVGKMPSEKQMTLIANDIIHYTDKQGVTVEDFGRRIAAQFYLSLEETAWSEGDMMQNFKVLKHASSKG